MRSKIRRLAILGLIAFSSIAVAADEPDVKGLIANLKSSKAAVRRSAAKELAEAGKKAADAVKELADAMGDDDAEVRYFAVAALGEIGPPAKSAARAMVERFDDPVFDIRVLTIEALPRLGPDAVPALIEAIKSKSYRVRINATMSAKHFGTALEPAIDALTKSLDDEVWMVRQNAGSSLAYAGPKAKSAIPKLIELAKSDENVHVRHNALDTLFELEADADDILPLAVAAMKDHDAYPKTRFVATARLDSLGVKARSAVPLLIELLKSDKEPAIRMHAALNLKDIGGRPDEILGPLTAALDDPDADVETGAARALRELGATAAPAVGAIRARLVALGNRDLPELVHWENHDRRIEMVEALGAIGGKSLPAIPEISALLKNSRPTIRATAARVLGTFGEDARAARPALEKAAGDGDPKVREAAGEALKRIGPAK